MKLLMYYTVMIMAMISEKYMKIERNLKGKKGLII